MTNTVLLEDMTPHDAQEYISLHKTINSENPYMIRPAGEYEIPLEQIENEAIRHLENRFKYWKVLRVNGEMVGHIRISRSSKERLKHKAELTIGLTQAYTGLGLGKMMMEDLIQWCQSAGLERLDLHVVSENSKGIALYEKFGFEVIGVLKNDIKISSDKYYDSLYMVKDLS